MARKMFLGGPFKALVDAESHVMGDADIDKYTSIIDFFEERGWDVHCAHRREGWGRDFMQPSECTRIDYDEIAAWGLPRVWLTLGVSDRQAACAAA